MNVQKCLKMTISLLYIALSCVLTISQLFSTLPKLREVCYFKVLFKVKLNFIWLPLTSRETPVRDLGRKLANVTKCNANKLRA